MSIENFHQAIINFVSTYNRHIAIIFVILCVVSLLIISEEIDARVRICILNLVTAFYWLFNLSLWFKISSIIKASNSSEFLAVVFSLQFMLSFVILIIDIAIYCYNIPFVVSDIHDDIQSFINKRKAVKNGIYGEPYWTEEEWQKITRINRILNKFYKGNNQEEVRELLKTESVELLKRKVIEIIKVRENDDLVNKIIFANSIKNINKIVNEEKYRNPPLF